MKKTVVEIKGLSNGLYLPLLHLNEFQFSRVDKLLIKQ